MEDLASWGQSGLHLSTIAFELCETHLCDWMIQVRQEFYIILFFPSFVVFVFLFSSSECQNYIVL